MIQTVTITKYMEQTTDKEGAPLVMKTGPRAGQPYTRVLIKTKEHGDVLISGFKGKTTLHEGQTIELDIDTITKGDRTFHNFRFVDKTAKLEDRVIALEKRVKALEDKNIPKVPQKDMTTSDGAPMPFPNDDDIDMSDSPF